MRRSLSFILIFAALTALETPVFGSSSQEQRVLEHRARLAGVGAWVSLLEYNENPSGGRWNFSGYDLVIFDPDAHPGFETLREETLRIAYVSVGEAESYRSYWDRVEDKSWVLHENPNWEGNYLVDVREEEWRRIVIDEVISRAIAKGFQGILLDTLDTAVTMEDLFPERYQGMKEAMVGFVKQIQSAYPDLILISNNGFPMLSGMAPHLSGLLVEDIHMMVDFENGGYAPVPHHDHEVKVEILQDLQAKHGLSVFNIDYVSQSDKELIRRCVSNSRKLGFNPYVAEKDLDRVYEN